MIPIRTIFSIEETRTKKSSAGSYNELILVNYYFADGQNIFSKQLIYLDNTVFD
jgi:hypothetical protein